MCDYTAVTAAVIEALRTAHTAGLDLSGLIPGLDATTGAMIVAESMEADALLRAPAEVLFAKPFDDFGDWTLAVLAQILFDIVREKTAPKRPIPDHLRELQTRAWAALELALDSPSASPLLWYEDIYFDVAQEYRIRGDPRALTIMKRGLAHNLQFNEGNNAESFLCDIAETYLWLGDVNAALSLYTALLRNEPDNIWHYNMIALTFCKGGLSRLGILATQRAQRLIETAGDSERLADQFRDSLARLEACAEPDQQSKLEPTILSDFSDSLSLAFDAGRDLSYPILVRELFPDLDSLPVKVPAEMPTLPPPRQSIASEKRYTAPSSAQENRQSPVQRKRVADKSLGRNDYCWCGSGKKYKHCHMREDRQARRDHG